MVEAIEFREKFNVYEQRTLDEKNKAGVGAGDKIQDQEEVVDYHKDHKISTKEEDQIDQSEVI